MNKGYGLILYLFIFESSIFARKIRDIVLLKTITETWSHHFSMKW